MSERYGACPICDGSGQLMVYVAWIGMKMLEMCGGCEGTGVWGGAFPPEWQYVELGK
jgi:DnaJ-class molecular chaperone